VPGASRRAHGRNGKSDATGEDAARFIEALTDVELLALFLRTGTRRQDVQATRRRYCSVLVRSTLCFPLIKRNWLR
jgi:hypothetical protein